MVFTSERPNKRVRARERNVGTIHKCQKKVKFGPTMKAIIFVFATYVHSILFFAFENNGGWA